MVQPKIRRGMGHMPVHPSRICENHYQPCLFTRRRNTTRSSETSQRQPESRLPSFLGDRKSTRLNSSHQIISYAVFCLKKKNLLLTYTFGTSPNCFFSVKKPTMRELPAAGFLPLTNL